MMILKHNGMLIASKVDIAGNFFKKALGLMLRRSIPRSYALVFIFKKPTTIGIHMLFMHFPIDVIFLDKDKKITATATLRPWFGHKKIRNVKYVIEMNTGTTSGYGLEIGDRISFDC